MSYPLVIRLMLAMTLMPGASYCEALAQLAGLLADVPFALAHPDLEGRDGMAAADPGGRDGDPVLACGRAADRRR